MLFFAGLLLGIPVLADLDQAVIALRAPHSAPCTLHFALCSPHSPPLCTCLALPMAVVRRCDEQDILVALTSLRMHRLIKEPNSAVRRVWLTFLTSLLGIVRKTLLPVLVGSATSVLLLTASDGDLSAVNIILNILAITFVCEVRSCCMPGLGWPVRAPLAMPCPSDPHPIVWLSGRARSTR